MASIVDTVTLACRLLKARPGLAAARVLTVTLVVTGVSAIVTVASATVLRALPFPEPDQLVRLYLQPPGTTTFNDANPLSPIAFRRMRERTTRLIACEGIWAEQRAVAGDDGPESVLGGRVSPGFFRLLGGDPAVGRAFTETETEDNAKVVVLSHGFWLRRFGGDPRVIGRTLLIDREIHTVIGVTPEGFEPGFASSELWTPLRVAAAPPYAALTAVQTIGRLKAGASSREVQAELDVVLADLRKEGATVATGWTAGTVNLRESQYGAQGPVLLILLAAVGVLALIATANLASLTLADVMHRRSDFAVRAALGGSRLVLALPEITQCLLVAAAGGVAGVLASAWLVPTMLSLDASTVVHPNQLAVDWRVLGCAFGAAVAVMAAAVAAPVLRLAGPGLASHVTAGHQRAVGGRGATRARALLVMAQTALALVLLSGGALLVNNFERAAHTNPGFDPSHVVTAQLRLAAVALPAELDRAVFIDRVLERVRGTPGVEAAGVTLNTFVAGFSFVTLVHIEGQPRPDGQPYTVQFRRTSPGYFTAMRIHVLQGRDFDRHDWLDTDPVVIVSRSFADRFWPNQNAIGRRIKRGAAAVVWSTVVGVVNDVEDIGVGQVTREAVYQSYFQSNAAVAPVGLVVRTSRDPGEMVKAIKQAVWDIDPGQPLSHVLMLDEFMTTTLGPQRFRATLLLICGALGLMLATVGTYGVTARSVIERRREVGIRLALGGTPMSVWRTLAWTSLRSVFVGTGIGLLVSGLVSRALVSLLPELQGTAWQFGALAGGLLILVGGLAALIAARSALGIEPLRALSTQ